MDNSINTKAFGKNDIRGIFPTEVNSEVFFCAAKGYVAFVMEELKKLKQEKTPRELLFAVCMDARVHSPELKRAIISPTIITPRITSLIIFDFSIRTRPFFIEIYNRICRVLK